MKQGHHDVARIYAQNAVRKRNEKLNLINLCSKIDAVTSKIQTAVTMRQVSATTAKAVRGMELSLKQMSLEKVNHTHYNRCHLSGSPMPSAHDCDVLEC